MQLAELEGEARPQPPPRLRALVQRLVRILRLLTLHLLRLQPRKARLVDRALDARRQVLQRGERAHKLLEARDALRLPLHLPWLGLERHVDAYPVAQPLHAAYPARDVPHVARVSAPRAEALHDAHHVPERAEGVAEVGAQRLALVQGGHQGQAGVDHG